MLFVWYLLKLLFVGPPSRVVEAPLRRRLNELESDIEQLQSDRESKRGQILTLQRRVRRIELDLWDDADEADEDDGDGVDELLEARRKAITNG